MLDQEGRAIIPSEFRSILRNPEKPEVHFYYSKEEDVFYIRLEKEGEIKENEFLVGVRKIDSKFRFRPLKEVVDKHGKCFLLAMKDGKIYFLPWKVKED